jgi:hypothetical protein
MPSNFLWHTLLLSWRASVELLLVRLICAVHEVAQRSHILCLPHATLAEALWLSQSEWPRVADLAGHFGVAVLRRGGGAGPEGQRVGV